MRLALLLTFLPLLAFGQAASTPGRAASLRVSGTLYSSTLTGTSTSGFTLTSSVSATGSQDTAFALNATNSLSKVAATDVLVDFNNAGVNVWRFWSSGFMTVTSEENNRAPGFELKAGTGGRLMWRLSGGNGEIAEMASNDTDITTWQFGTCPATNCIMNLGPNASGTAELVLTKGTGGPAAKFNVRLDFDSTDNSASPGATTINKPAGKAAVAAAASSVVVTNSLVSTSSIVLGVLQASDSTCTSIKSIVPASGSFTVTLNSTCTAATKIGWVVHN